MIFLLTVKITHNTYHTGMRTGMVFASVDDYEITAGVCRAEGAKGKESYDLHLILQSQPKVTIFDFDSNRDMVVGFAERLKYKTIDLDGISELIEDYLGEAYGLPFGVIEESG